MLEDVRRSGFTLPGGCEGALVLSGTRVPVEVLRQHLTAGDSLDAFPGASRARSRPPPTWR